MNADSDYASASAAADEANANYNDAQAAVTSGEQKVTNTQNQLDKDKEQLNSASSALSDANAAVTRAENGQEIPAAVWKTGTTTESLSQQFFAKNAFVKLLPSGQVEITLHMTSGKQYVGSLSYKGTDLTASNANGDAVDWTFSADPATTYDLAMSINTPIGHMNQTATISVDGTIYNGLLEKQKDAQAAFDVANNAVTSDNDALVTANNQLTNALAYYTMRANSIKDEAQKELTSATEKKEKADQNVENAKQRLAEAKAALTTAQNTLVIAKVAAEKQTTPAEEVSPNTETTQPTNSTTEQPAANQTTPAEEVSPNTETTQPTNSTTEQPAANQTTPAEEVSPNAETTQPTSENATPVKIVPDQTTNESSSQDTVLNETVAKLMNATEIKEVSKVASSAATNANQKVVAVKKAMTTSSTLPQTGNDATSLTLLGIALAMLGFAPLAKLRRY
ncbi:LPXTG cell wall anchor domain-containing protein [Limosilactobacillus gastricus]|uniref:LPXTG cell wall anchor domain-containing protein n=1 Tax=Limosilactobacillus gastricus TaxID=227942 RepID=UPI0026ED6CF9|nr:LPXTG cell wall anchor domain-containing protein [Limosilactobacillus gastricus]